MMATQPGRTWKELHHGAVSALTRIAIREDRGVGAGFGDDLSGILTSVAANLGGAAQMASGDRAEQVLAFLPTTAPEALAPHRTEPIRLLVDPATVLDELGWDDLYHDSRLALQGLEGFSQIVPVEEIPAALVRLEELRAQDEAEWYSAFTRTATDVAARLGVAVAVEVIRREESAAPSSSETDELENLIFDKALGATPLPGSGIALDDYTGAPIAQTEVTAGRMPHQRLLSRDQ